jgi:tetratricopeptide (TPR) repeat protein
MAGRLSEWAAILVLSLIAYSPALTGTLLWDDAGHLTRADLRPVEGLRRIWFEIGATQQYYPVLHSAFWIEHRLWGDSVAGYHIANIALHSLSAFLLILILRRLAIRGAFVAGLIFALHPVMVESVAWISEQKNALSAVFYLAAALSYLHFDRSRRRVQYVLGFVLFVLALLSKSVTATLPAGLLLAEWWQRGRLSWKRDIMPLVPWFAAAAAAGAVTIWFEREAIGARGPDFALSFLDRCLIAGRAFWFYLAKLFWPANLTFIYPRWTIDSSVWWQHLFPIGAIALAAAAARVARVHRGPAAGLFFFTVTLFPALGFFDVYPFRFSFVADHFQYLASIGIIVPVAYGLTIIAERIGSSNKAGAFVACAVPIAVLATLTWRQAAMYRNAETLYKETIARNPNAWMAYMNLGTELANANRLPEAIHAFEGALRVRPDYPEARRNLAMAHFTIGNALADKGMSGAIEAYEAALKIDPDNAEAHLNLGSVLSETPARVPEAIAHYRAALAIKPAYFLAHYNLGTLLLDDPAQHRHAVAHLEAALRLQPESPEAHVNMAVALADTPATISEAIRHLEVALAGRPDFTAARELLAELRGRIPRSSRAR